MIVSLLAAAAITASAPEDLNLLVFSKTAAFRHGSIPDGVKAIKKLGADNDFSVHATEDAAVFDKDISGKFDVVLFLSTTGDILNRSQEKNMEKFIQGGGGYVGIHAAADTEYDWEWYGKLVGAYFKSHPAIQEATVMVLDRKHISTKHLPSDWVRRDEWYDYRARPADDVHILCKLMTTSYTGHTMGLNHPIAWCHEYDGGRAFYTGGGHTKETFSEPDFMKHVLGGILWAAKRAD